MYASPNIIRMINLRMMRGARHVARMGEINAYKIFVGKPEGKILLKRPRRRWQDNIRMDLREIRWEGGCIWLRLGTSDGLL